MLQDPYFSKPPPKSTGRERFNQGWIEQQLNPSLPKRQAEAIQATLLELSAQTIAQAIITESANNTEVYLCGGGARNDTLVSRITTLLAPRPVMKTDQLGVPGDWVEAMAFAWLAHRCLSAEPGNEPAVTGAQAPRILGGIYQA
jgi:anhydro-N-acetylmuramic acid kinase